MRIDWPARNEALPSDVAVLHRHAEVDGVGVFFREAGPADAQAILPPHGYPSSTFHFRRLMPALADRWRLVAPDFPGFGYSDTPEDFDYSFGGYTEFLDRFARSLRLDRYALYLHDYGSQIGLRLAIKAPERVAALILQNGDIYEDVLGPKYDALKTHWANATREGRAKPAEVVSEEGFRHEFVGEVDEHLINRIPPDLWQLAWSLMTAKRWEVMAGLMEGLRENLGWYPEIPSVPSRATAADPDRLGAAGRLHAGGIGARLPPRPARRRAAPAGRRALGAGDQPRRDRGADPRLPQERPTLQGAVR